MDVLQSELGNFDVICEIESWLDGRTSHDDIKIENCKQFRRDMPGYHHGGICVIFVITFFFSKRRHDLELPNIECISVEISIKQNTIHSKKDGKDKESIQSSTTPDPRYQSESDNVTIRHHKREPRCQPFPSS